MKITNIIYIPHPILLTAIAFIVFCIFGLMVYTTNTFKKVVSIIMMIISGAMVFVFTGISQHNANKISNSPIMSTLISNKSNMNNIAISPKSGIIDNVRITDDSYIKYKNIKILTVQNKGSQVYLTPNNQTGKAVIKVLNYYNGQKEKKELNYIKATLYGAILSYQNTNGEHKVICYINNNHRKVKDNITYLHVK